MGQQDDNKSQPTTTAPVLATPDTAKPSLSRRLLHKTLQHAQDAVSDTTRNIAGVADAALDALDQVTTHTRRSCRNDKSGSRHGKRYGV